MDFEKFSLNSREEVETFETYLYEYVGQKSQFSIQHFSLAKAYDIFQSTENGNRIFVALLDITINYVLLWSDCVSVGSVWNKYFSKGKLEGGTILDSQAKFFGKMEIHRFNSSFILRYRGLWDKIMGFLVLLFACEKYDGFYNSKSKKKSFKKIIIEMNELPSEYREFLKKFLEDPLTKFDNLATFDNKFRTSEVHGTGALRKYSFTMQSMSENPQIELIGYWNIVNWFITKIDEMLEIYTIKIIQQNSNEFKNPK